MRPLWKDILIAAWLGIIIPGITLNATVLFLRAAKPVPISAVETSPEPPETVLLRQEMGEPVTVDMLSYLTGVVLAEMPSAFLPDALKAQAVAARTYVRKAELTGGKHGDGSICPAPSCCQGYISEEDYLSGGGTRESLEKVRRAVEETESYVLEYGGELIEAVYFSSSGGTTESALAVWGTDFPYLQSVESPGEENARYHADSLVLSTDEFFSRLKLVPPEDMTQWFGSIQYTEGGGVAEMEIAGKTFTGTELRTLLSLRSTAFTINLEGENIRIATKGYGHRVGMSQYGANAMAEAGSTWQEILAHYYPGTSLGVCS